MSYDRLEKNDVVNFTHEHNQGSLYHPYRFGVVTEEVARVKTDSGNGRLLALTTDESKVERFLELPEKQQKPFTERSMFRHWFKEVILHPDGKLHWAGHFYGMSHHGDLDAIREEMASHDTPRTKYAIGSRWKASFTSDAHPELNCSRVGKVLFHAKYGGSGYGPDEHIFFVWDSKNKEPLIGQMREANHPGAHGIYIDQPACEVYRQNFGGWRYYWLGIEFQVYFEKEEKNK